MKREDLTPRIEAPKYKIGRFTFNEYEVREIIARVAEGTLSHEKISITDMKGNTVTLNEDGTTTGDIYGWSIATSKTMRRLRANRYVESNGVKPYRELNRSPK